MIFTAWMAGVGCFTGLILAALCATCPPAPGTCADCGRVWRTGLAFALGCLFVMLGALAAAVWMEGLTSRGGDDKLSAGRVTTGPSTTPPTGRAARESAISQVALLPVGGALLTDRWGDRYHHAVPREHKIASLINDPMSKGTVSCACGWRHVNALDMARFPATDKLLDEYNAHLERCRKASDGA